MELSVDLHVLVSVLDSWSNESRAIYDKFFTIGRSNR